MRWHDDGSNVSARIPTVIVTDFDPEDPMNTQSTTAAAPNKSRVNSEQGMMILLAVIVAISVLGVMLVGG
jgi:hypothetical protein